MDINGFLMLNGRGAGPYTEDLAMRFLARAVTENSLNNAWNVNFNSGNVNNNNNKNNQNVTRAVAALGECPEHFVLSVWQAYLDCLRGKTSSPDALAYMTRAAEDVPPACP